MRAVRLCSRRYPSLDGEGSSITGGRWNSPGKAVVYAASCAALASLEYLVHVRQLPKDMVLLLIEIPDTLKLTTTTWVPADPAAVRQIGDEWLESRESAVLSVPSVLIPRQTNYLINPHHHLFESIQVAEIIPFAFDRRVFADPNGPMK
jgi:RES domain-containing protein